MTSRSELTDEQQQLRDYMSELSEEMYCAGWLMGLEFALWEAAQGTRSSFGGRPLEDTELQKLRSLSESCGGWIYWDERKDEHGFELGESFAPLEAWKARFAEAMKP